MRSGQALARAELEPAVKCVVLTGAGKGFCAGGDVKGMAARGDGTVGDNTIDGAIHRQRVNQRATAGALFKMPKPTWPRCRARRPARGSRWRWPATCGSWPAPPS